MKTILPIFLATFFLTASVKAQKTPATPEIGVAQNLENDSLLRASGYKYLVESISKWFSPKNVSDEQFKENLKLINGMKTPLYACNIFMPGELKLVGRDVKEQSILAYSEGVFKRCFDAKVKMIIWGSGGARRIPEGFNRKKAQRQFISIAKKVAELAKKYGITLALENLNSTETNFITRVDEARTIVKRVNHPNFRLCVDIYHMLKEGELPAIIEKTQKYIVHCDIAERKDRNPPGVTGEDFKPYLAMLKKIGYEGKIIVECRWDNLDTQAEPAYVYLKNQIDEVWGIEEAVSGNQ